MARVYNVVETWHLMAFYLSWLLTFPILWNWVPFIQPSGERESVFKNWWYNADFLHPSLNHFSILLLYFLLYLFQLQHRHFCVSPTDAVYYIVFTSAARWEIIFLTVTLLLLVLQVGYGCKARGLHWRFPIVCPWLRKKTFSASLIENIDESFVLMLVFKTHTSLEKLFPSRMELMLGGFLA